MNERWARLLDRLFPARVERRAMLAALRDVAAQLDRVEAAARDANRRFDVLEQQGANARPWLEKISVESQNAFAHADGRAVNEFLRVRQEADAHAAGARQTLAELALRLAEVRPWLEKLSLETTNAALHAEGRSVTLSNRLFNEAFPNLHSDMHRGVAWTVERVAREPDRSGWVARAAERYRAARVDAFAELLQRASADFGRVWPWWKSALDETSAAFAETKVGNAAHAEDVYSRLFRVFVESHVRGRVLDVGCGVFGVPYYLEGYPRSIVSGLDPLEQRESGDFEFVRGLSEYLPWDDGAFSTVISATSLDHALSLEKTLAEIERVLTRDGRFLLWIGSMPGAAPFEPERADFEPADRFHLFHFDVAWFEPLIRQRWEVRERLEFPQPSFTHVFYALTPRDAGAAA